MPQKMSATIAAPGRPLIPAAILLVIRFSSILLYPSKKRRPPDSRKYITPNRILGDFLMGFWELSPGDDGNVDLPHIEINLDLTALTARVEDPQRDQVDAWGEVNAQGVTSP